MKKHPVRFALRTAGRLRRISPPLLISPVILLMFFVFAGDGFSGRKAISGSPAFAVRPAAGQPKFVGGPIDISPNYSGSGTTIGQGNSISTYYNPGTGEYVAGETGPDVVYCFTLDSLSDVVITLAASVDLDLFLLNAPSPNNVVAWSLSWGGDEEIRGTFPAGTYYIAIDGYGGAAGSYTLTVSSDAPPPTPVPRPTGPPGTNRYGLMVGIDHYATAYGPGDLPSCINDANGFGDGLLRDGYRWNPATITTLTDSTATKAAIRGQLSGLAGSAAGGELVVYFHSSHGGTNGDTNAYLCSYNADYNDWELAADLANFADGVAVIIVLDACYSGGMFKERGELVWPFAKNVLKELARIKRVKGIAKGPSVGFMTACDYYEYCNAGDPYSLFTGYLIEGFTHADANGDGNVTFKELFDYAEPRALAENPFQHAQSDNDPLLAATVAVGGALESLVIDSGDYDGDGTSDLAVFRPASGLWAVRGITRAYFGSSGDLPVPGDFDGNGTTDIAVFRPGSGLWAIKGGARVYFGGSGDIPVPGDYAGSGTSAVGIYRASSGLWAIKGVTRTYFGGTGDTPVPGYYGTSGKKIIGIFRPSSGLWAIQGIPRRYFGSTGDIPVPGDYDGSGGWAPGIFRASSGLWAVKGVTRAYFGGSSDSPFPGDYRGDGTDCLGIFRGTSGLWAIKGVTRAYFGGSSDIPVTR
jgi:hypothetical protein